MRWPEAETGPRPARPQTTLTVLGRHAARDRNQPTGPLALSASHAPGRNLGVGRESFFPPGLNLGPVIVSRPSQSDGCARFPAEQNRVLRRCANPSLISLLFRSLSRAAASDSERPTSGAGESEPEAPPGAPSRCARSPLGECATVEWPQRRFFTFARPDEAASIGSVEISSPTQIQKRCGGEILGPATRRLAVVGFYPQSPQIHNLSICGRR
jgi:hypothetical protein